MPGLHTRFPLWIVLLAVIGTLCHGHIQEHTTDANTIQTPISIVLPPHNFANIYTSEIACNNVSLSDLTSSLPSPTSLTFSAFGIQVLCQANWTNSIDNVNGTIQALVANSNVSLGLALLMGSSGLVSGVNATQCEAGAQVANLEIEGGSMDNSTKLAISAYITYSFQRAMCGAFADSIANLTTYIEQENDNIFNWISPPVLPPPDTDTSTFVKFTDNAFLGAIEYVTDTLVGANGPLGLNKLVNLATNNTGTLIIPNVTEFLPKIHLAVPPYYTMPLQGYGTATLGVYSMNLTGLNSWSDVELFHPYDNFTLDFIAALADVELSAHLYVNITAENGVEGPSVYDEVILKVNFSQIEFRTVVFAGLESAILQNLSANQLTSPGCLLPAINQIAFRLFELSINVSGVEVLPLASSTSTQVDWLVFNLATLAVPSFLPVIAPLLNSFLDTTGIELATYGIELALQYLHLPCAPKQAINTHTFNQASTIYALIGAAGLFFIIGAGAFIIKYQRSKRDPYLDERAPLYGESASPRVNDAIILTDEVPVLVRYGIVALILANIALFVSSNTSIGASVYLVIKANGQDAINFPSLFDFSLGNSVRDMWNAGVYPLSILIAVFSGIWPYVKLALLLACWVIPFGKISVVHRERTLLLLDALGKCSLIDSFVMILMMVAFHFSISPPVTPYTPEGSLIVQTWVQPHYGFYAFICATILSLITTHIIVSYHRRATNEVERINNDDKKSLLAYSRKSGSLAFVISVLVLSLVATALVAVGLSIISFDFEFRGAFGYLLTLIDQPTTTSYSVFSLGSGIPSSSANPHYAGIVLLQISFFIFICVTPLSYLVLLILLWVWPLTYQAQRRLLHVTEVVQAWASLEVFVVAVIAALVELQQFAQFILGNRCDQINPYLEKYFGPMLDGDDKCFDVAAYLKTGCWVTFSACILYLVIGVFVIHRCHKALRYRLEDIQQNAING